MWGLSPGRKDHDRLFLVGPCARLRARPWCWYGLLLVAEPILVRPRGGLLLEALRLCPRLRLIRRLAADKTLPHGVRVRLVLLLAYLAIPIDLIPDFVPILGYADDAIIVTAVLRSVVRGAGLGAIRAHWPDTDDGFAAVVSLAGLRSPPNDGDYTWSVV